MNNYDKSQILLLIQEWVDSLEDHELNEECRNRGRSFFNFMKARGVPAAYLAKVIINATGHNPAQLWRVDDAELLRDAIYNYRATEDITEADEAEGNQRTARDNFLRFWGKR